MNNRGRVTIWIAVVVVVLVVGWWIFYSPYSPLRHEMAGEHTYKEITVAGVTKYYCAMHPWIIQDKPGNCPLCGMQLVPLEPGKAAAPAASSPVEGLAVVQVPPDRQQLLGVRTASVEERDLVKTIRTVGRVEWDERRIAYVQTKFEGWVEKVFVDYTGKYVKKGQPLLSIYSPDLVSAQEEFLIALEAKKRLGASGYPDVAKGGADLLESARRRLLLWDITEAQIEELAKTGKVKKSLILHSPLSGYVTEKMVFPNQMVKPDMKLYIVADLSTVWIQADLYESEVGIIKPGHAATVTLPYEPGVKLEGRVAYVYPYLEKETRTVKVRFEFPNKEGKLKPQMYANVELHVPLGKQIAVPEEAVIDTGTRKVVFVQTGPGQFEPREIHGGQRVEPYVAVPHGLKAGEQVVTSAQFLIDSESRFKAAVAATGMPPEHKH